jgi:hypothetical protein
MSDVSVPYDDAAAAAGDPAHDLESRARARTLDQDRTLAAVQDLEAALSAAAPSRLAAWSDDVLTAIEALAAATAEEEANATEPDSLLSEIACTRPRFRHRVHGIRSQYRHVRETIETLREELGTGAGDLDYTDVRHRLAWVLAALRYERAREADLIHEALSATSSLGESGLDGLA